MRIKNLFLILSCAFFLAFPCHSQSQFQSTSQALDEQILKLENFQLDFQKLKDDFLKQQLLLLTAEEQLNESQLQSKKAMELSQELSKALDKSETKYRIWKNVCIVSTTVAVITTATTTYLLYRLNK